MIFSAPPGDSQWSAWPGSEWRYQSRRAEHDQPQVSGVLRCQLGPLGQSAWPGGGAAQPQHDGGGRQAQGDGGQSGWQIPPGYRDFRREKVGEVLF